jgi:HEAT repeat protein
MKTPDPERLEKAFKALEDYGPGSSRGDLLAIDESARAVLQDDTDREALEGRLLQAMNGASTEGQVYLLSQLALIGSPQCLETLSELLADPELTDPARRTLEALPHPEAADVLRSQLPDLEGISRIGVIHALGRKRDVASVPLLQRLLKDPDSGTAEAVVASLGRIASPEAARTLRKYVKGSPPELKEEVDHAVRDCADRLKEEGHDEEAARLLDAVG